jgi:hypothetical protein
VIDGDRVLYQATNRNKQGVTADPKSPAGGEAVRGEPTC